MITERVEHTYQFKRGTAERLAEVNPILAEGEPAFETNTYKQKIGDGFTPYKALPYTGEGGSLPPTPIVPESVQADWEQNDSTQPDYIKNRTHYVEPGKSYTWDGDTSNRERVFYENWNSWLYKITDDVYPTFELFWGGKISVVENGESGQLSIECGSEPQELIPGGYLDPTGYFLSVFDAKLFGEYNGDTSITEGLYVVYYDNNTYIVGIELPETIVKIDEKFLPELATVAKTGNYNDLNNLPETLVVDQVYNATSENAQSGKAVAQAVYGKQDKLNSGVNIKTINGETILGEGNIEIKVVQPDWNQNDPTAPDYVKNRTHYEEESIVGITFDGNLDSRVVADAYDGDFKIVKVSDDLPSAEDLIGQTVTFTYQDGSTVEYGLEEENIGTGDRNLWITHNIDKAMYPSLFIVNSSEDAANDIGGSSEDIPLGTYFVCAVDNYDYYISSLASITRNIKKIDEKFLPEFATVAKTGNYSDLIDAPDVYTRDTIDTNFATKTEAKAYANSIDIRKIVGGGHNEYTTLLLTDIGTTENATLKILNYRFDTSIDVSNVAVDLYDNVIAEINGNLTINNISEFPNISLYGDGELLATTLATNTTQDFKPISFTFTPQSNISELVVSNNPYSDTNKFSVNLVANTTYTLVINTHYTLEYSTISLSRIYICEGEPYASITADTDSNLDVSNLTIPETLCISTDIRYSLEAKYQVCEQYKLIDVSLDSKQDALVSGVNIKTINGETILGEGNIIVGGDRIPKLPTNGAPFYSVTVYDDSAIGSGEIPSDSAYTNIYIEDVSNAGMQGGFLLCRDRNNNIQTSTPLNDIDCANKKYVDDAVANARDSIKLKDSVTNKIYTITMVNGTLTAEEVTE